MGPSGAVPAAPQYTIRTVYLKLARDGPGGHLMLQIELLPLLSDNYAYLLHDQEAGASAVVDPGEAGPVLAALRERGRGLDLVLCTHHHGDHTNGNLELKAATGCRVVGPEAERARVPGIDRGVREGDEVEVGGSTLRVIETPGHTAGHVSFHAAREKAVFCGDTLFALGCGRLLERDALTMWDSLCKLASLPDETGVYCGHEYTEANARFALSLDPDNEALLARAGEVGHQRAVGAPTVPSTIGEEWRTNPFLRATDPYLRARLGLQAGSEAEAFAEIRRRKDAFR
jgi:hydroxyacylglutathione hydrolase